MISHRSPTSVISHVQCSANETERNGTKKIFLFFFSLSCGKLNDLELGCAPWINCADAALCFQNSDQSEFCYTNDLQARNWRNRNEHIWHTTLNTYHAAYATRTYTDKHMSYTKSLFISHKTHFVSLAKPPLQHLSFEYAFVVRTLPTQNIWDSTYIPCMWHGVCLRNAHPVTLPI